MTERRPWFRFRTLTLVLCMVTSAGQAGAALGKAVPAASTSSAAVQMHGARVQAATPMLQSNAYSSHLTQLPNGTAVTEYATPAGIVFAVKWRGPVLPDLNDLLGDYFDTFNQITKQARLAGRRGTKVHVDVDGLVLTSSGRMRNFFGFAYAPALVPPSVNIDDVLQ